MDKIAKFYIFNNKLKKRLRTGWLDVKISSDRIESISEHIYGCLILAISINSEYKLNLDMERVLKMITLHELEEIILPDYSNLSNITKEEKLRLGKQAVVKVIDGLIDKDEIESLIDEFNSRETKIAKFAYHIDKIEADYQAKIYDLDGAFDIEEEKKDALAWNGADILPIIEEAKCASDIWLDCDKYLYADDPLFSELQESIKNITKEEYDEILSSEVIDN